MRARWRRGGTNCDEFPPAEVGGNECADAAAAYLPIA